MVVVVDVVLVVVVGLNGAALVVVDVVLVDVEVVVVGNGINVVVDVVLDEVDVLEITTIFKFNSLVTGAMSVLNRNSNLIFPSPLVRKLVLAAYLVPPGTVGVRFVYKGPCLSGVTDPTPVQVT